LEKHKPLEKVKLCGYFLSNYAKDEEQKCEAQPLKFLMYVNVW